MKIDVETSDDVATVTLTGSLIAGEDLGTLRDTIDDLLRRGYRRLVLDLSGVPMIDSAGLGEIVRLYTTVSRRMTRRASDARLVARWRLEEPADIGEAPPLTDLQVDAILARLEALLA